MEITTVSVITIVTIIVTYVFGIIAKKIPCIKDEYIPLQNIVIGLASGIICGILNIEGLDVGTGMIICLSSSLGAAGIYDATKIKSNK